ncbi:MAG: hypothetical protein K2X35_23620 [Bryobacteraceae bacterium]|nr:hypothetical protein [Bryobacteraceae bacterium]
MGSIRPRGKRTAQSWSIPGTKLQVASAWAKRGIELPRALELALQDRVDQEKVIERMNGSSDLFPMPGRELSQESNRWMQNTLAGRTLSVIHAKFNNAESARQESTAWESALARRRDGVAAI